MRIELVYLLEPFSTDFDSDRMTSGHLSRLTFSEIKLVHSHNTIKFTVEAYDINYKICRLNPKVVHLIIPYYMYNLHQALYGSRI